MGVMARLPAGPHPRGQVSRGTPFSLSQNWEP